MSYENQVNYSTGTNYVTVQDFNTVAQKRPTEQSMFTIRTYQYIDGKYGADILFEGRIVETAQRTWKTEAKARQKAQEYIDGAVARLFVFE